MTPRLLSSRKIALVLSMVLSGWCAAADADTPAARPSGSTPATAAPAGSPAAPPPPPTPAANSESVVARILAGITRVGPGSATMRREARDLILSNLAIFARAARAVPAQEDGAIGYRLSGIRRGSVLAAIGLQNGDLLQSINGRPTTSPQEVLAAYSGLRGQSSWSLRVRRRGADTTLSVRVIDDAAATATPAASPGTSRGASPAAP